MTAEFVLEQKNNIWYGSFPLLTEAGFANGCSCRFHGESSIVPGTLNLALHVGDSAEMVLANRRLYAGALGTDAGRFTTCRQVHGSHVERIDADRVGSGAFSLDDSAADTDALITCLPDVPLLLFYADCVPVLLADPATGACGLAHAGWRGTVARIAARTVRAMEREFGSRPEDMLAAIGPSIGSCCYEVDDYVRGRACGYEEFFAPVKGRDGHYMLDLWGMNRRILQEAGVPAGNIAAAEVCTAHNHQLFCSHRAEQGRTGRMGVCIYRKK